MWLAYLSNRKKFDIHSPLAFGPEKKLGKEWEIFKGKTHLEWSIDDTIASKNLSYTSKKSEFYPQNSMCVRHSPKFSDL